MSKFAATTAVVMPVATTARGGEFINSQAYCASRFIETDKGVSYVWKGLLEWQDVERVQTVLRSSVD